MSGIQPPYPPPYPPPSYPPPSYPPPPQYPGKSFSMPSSGAPPPSYAAAMSSLSPDSLSNGVQSGGISTGAAIGIAAAVLGGVGALGTAAYLGLRDKKPSESGNISSGSTSHRNTSGPITAPQENKNGEPVPEAQTLTGNAIHGNQAQDNSVQGDTPQSIKLPEKPQPGAKPPDENSTQVTESKGKIAIRTLKRWLATARKFTVLKKLRNTARQVPELKNQAAQSPPCRPSSIQGLVKK